MTVLMAAQHPPRSVPPRARAAVLGLIAVLTVTGALGFAFFPYLLVEHPVLLIALAPRGRNLVLAAGSVELWLLLLVGTTRRVIGLLAAYGIGALYGDTVLRWAEARYPRLGKVIRALERYFERFGAPLLVVLPIRTLSVLAGASGTRFAAFVFAVALGQCAIVGATLIFGEAISHWTAPVVAFLREHVVESTIVCIALLAAQQLFTRLRGGRKRDATVPS